MKAIKIIIVAALVAALGFGIYKLVSPCVGPDCNGTCDTCIVIPEGCELTWQRQHVDSSFSSIPEGGFDRLNQCCHQLTVGFKADCGYLAGECMDALLRYVSSAQRNRFVDMVDSEFKGASWPHFDLIDKMNDSLLVKYTGSKDLTRIANVCTEYKTVRAYNYRVNKYAKQRPSSIGDKWTLGTDATSKLLSDTPSASEPVSHTDQYSKSRKDATRETLYKGHRAFLEALAKLAIEEIKDNPTKSNYDRAFNAVTNEIERLANYDDVYQKSYSTLTNFGNELVSRIRANKPTE